MGEVLFSATCVSNKSCDDSWFLAINFLGAAIGVLLFMYQEECFELINKYLGSKSQNKPDENSRDSNEDRMLTSGNRKRKLSKGSRKLSTGSKVKTYNEDTTKDMGYFKTVFYFYQCVPLLTIQNNMAESYLLQEFSPFIIAIFSFKPVALFLNICPFPGLTYVPRTLLGNTTTFLTFALVGVVAVVNNIYQCIKAKKNRNRSSESPTTTINYDDEILLSSQNSSNQSSSKSAPSLNARVAFATVNLFLFNYVNIATVTWAMIGCIQLGDDVVMYFDGTQSCYQPWQYIFILIMVVHVVPFFLVVMVSRSLLEADKISVTQFFVSYVLPLPMLAIWFCVWLKNEVTVEKFKSRISKHFTESNRSSTQGTSAIQEGYNVIPKRRRSSARSENPIDNIIESGTHDNTSLDYVDGDDDDDGITFSSNGNDLDEGQSIKSEILLVVSEPYVNHDKPWKSVKYWEGVLILRRLALSLCSVAYPDVLLTATLQTAVCLIFLVWHVCKQPFGTRGPNNLETFFLTSLTGMSALHMIQGTLASAGIKAQAQTLLQIFVTDWIELTLQAAIPMVIVVYIVLWILLKLGQQLFRALRYLFSMVRSAARSVRSRGFSTDCFHPT